MYKDPTRKNEISAISNGNEFNEFYSRLKNIKDFYKNHPNDVAIPISQEFDDFLATRDNEINLIEFTDEESYGKFLDLFEHFNLYLNLKNIVGSKAIHIDYLSYLNKFDHFYEISKEKKFTAEYQKYLESLRDYLEGYIIRVKPLLPLPEVRFSSLGENSNSLIRL